MAKLVWGTLGDRFYETGVDHGVLYPTPDLGVAWNGLTSVNESVSGGEPTPFYIDGFKYLNLSAAEEFAATIQAFSAPKEFDVCDGIGSIALGLSITQQPRKDFGFSYQTKVGNDTEGLDHGYKIHLVYNALAAPSSRDNNTINSSVNPIQLSWAISTSPKVASGYRPSAHFIIDSRVTGQSLLHQIEDILYGTSITAPRLISPVELMTMFGAYDPFVVHALPNGEYSAEGTDVQIATPATFTIVHEDVVNHGDGSFTIYYEE